MSALMTLLERHQSKRGALALNKRAGDAGIQLVDEIVSERVCHMVWQGMYDSYGAEGLKPSESSGIKAIKASLSTAT